MNTPDFSATPKKAEPAAPAVPKTKDEWHHHYVQELKEARDQWLNDIKSITEKYSEAIGNLDAIRSGIEKNPLKQTEFWVSVIPWALGMIAFLWHGVQENVLRWAALLNIIVSKSALQKLLHQL